MIVVGKDNMLGNLSISISDSFLQICTQSLSQPKQFKNPLNTPKVERPTTINHAFFLLF